VNDLQDAGDETQGKIARFAKCNRGDSARYTKLQREVERREEGVGDGKPRLKFPAVDPHYG
jgi:hypothetical protein